MPFMQSISEQILAGLAGTIIGYIGKVSYDNLIKFRKNRAFIKFLDFPKSNIVIIHSALYDDSRNSYNYPSCDMISARQIANLLEAANKKETIDFRIEPETNCMDAKGTVVSEILKCNLILLGGPKRNKITNQILTNTKIDFRYKMTLDPSSGENQIVDKMTGNHYNPKEGETTDERIDYGLIMTMRNPLNSERGVLMVAGIHGPGTIGSSKFISKRENLVTLSRKRKGGAVQEIIQTTHYTDKTDNVKDICLITFCI